MKCRFIKLLCGVVPRSSLVDGMAQLCQQHASCLPDRFPQHQPRGYVCVEEQVYFLTGIEREWGVRILLDPLQT